MVNTGSNVELSLDFCLFFETPFAHFCLKHVFGGSFQYMSLRGSIFVKIFANCHFVPEDELIYFVFFPAAEDYIEA